MCRYLVAPLRLGRVTVRLFLLATLLAAGCGVDTQRDEGAPGAQRGVAKTGLDGPPIPVGPFLDGVFPPRTPNDAVSTTWDLVEAFPNLTFNQTLVITSNPSDDRLYVGSRDGNIFSFDKTIPGVSNTEPFMDLRDRAAVVWDGGFLGLAFHPEFGTPLSPNETTFYVYYSSYCPTVASGASHIVDFNNCNPGYPTGSTGGFFNTWLRASRFDAFWDAGAGVWRGDATTEEPLFNIRLYNGSHRGGGPVFGHDGYMYIMIGDQFHYETAQDISGNFEGGSIRLAVDVTDNGDGTWTCPAGSHQPVRTMQDVTGLPDEMTGHQYCIPDDNPWVSPGGLNFGEFFSIGHRNPHRVSVDTETGQIWSGEVGQSTREEINVILKGRNYQWPFMEGLVPFRDPPTTILGIEQPPVIDFVRTEARTIIGGYVYRGTKFPELFGKFLAGDYSTNNVWAITLDETTMTATKDFLATFTPGGLSTFGQDNDGEVYLGDVFGNKALYTLDRIGGPVPEPPALLSQTDAFQDLVTLDPNPAWVPYELNQPFWSDDALKHRWIASPNDGTRDTADEQITYSETGLWGYPVGTVLMKHFELQLDESDPSDTTKLETRFLILGDDGEWYGVTYRWKTSQLDADLLTVGETADYDIQLAGGGTRTQTWLFPSRTQCMACHIPASGGALGLRTHQQNGDIFYSSTGRTDNQLVTWNHLGMFSPAIDEATIPNLLRSVEFTDVTASLEDRARSWLDSNCGYCHRPGGVNAGFDARLTTPFENQGMVYGGVRNDLGIPGLTVLTPGDPDLSAIYQRAAAVGPFAMPPLAKALAQTPAVDILGEWILRVDPNLGTNGVNYQYYETGDLTELPDFGTLAPAATGTASAFDIGIRQQDDYFAIRFTSLLYVDVAGDYTFFTSSDEGSELWLDGALVVDNGGLHGDQEEFGVTTVAQGYHSIEVTMFERDGAEALTVSWQGPDTSGVKEQIPVGRLFLQQPTVNNDPPTLTDPGPVQNTIGESVSMFLQATDPNGDLLYYDATGLPPGLTLDHTTGEIAGVLTAAALGTHDVTASASDASEVSVVTYQSTVSAAAGGCGDGAQDAGEECDDGNLTDGDGCTSTCVLEFCGDGVVNNGGVETCDPPNTTLCSSTCTIIAGGMSCASDSDCDDGDVCTDDQCDPGTNTCLYDYIAVACDDQNACTVVDVCALGACVGGDLAGGCTSCEGVADLPAEGGTFFGSIAGSSFMGGSCGATGNTPERVYRWVPAVSGPVTIETCGPETDYDTALYIRSDDCETGAELGCNDDTVGCGVNDGRSNAARHGSRLQLVVEQDRPYFIVVSGYNGRTGNYKLTLSPPSPPTTLCGNGVVDAGEQCDGSDAASCVTGLCQGVGDPNPCLCEPPASAPDLASQVSELGIEFDTTVPSEDVAEGCASATSGIDILRFRTDTVNVGNADMVLGDPGCPNCNSNPGASCANPNFVCSPPGGHGHPHYDNFARFDLVDTTTRAVVATTHKRGFCLRDSFCDTGSATYGCGFQGISAGCGDTYRRTLGCQFVEITGVPSGDYELQVTVDPFDLFPELDETNNLSSVPVTISRGGPPGTAIPLPPLGGVVAGVTSGASAYSGSCASGATTNSPDALFSLTATTSGTYTVQTCSQNTLYDTVMYVREGALDGAEIGCDDDTIGCGVNDGSGNAARHGSSVPINATAGETYYIFVDGYNAGGPFELTVTRPDGGLCGDDTADGPEECDGTDDAACPGLCLADCNCAPPPSVCGDDIMEGSEACDGTDDTACPGLCLADCNCSVCGDDVSEGTEACDGADDAACPGLCQSDCTCPPPGPVCGDDTQEGLEECDGSDDLACPGLCLPDCNCIPPTAINTMLVPFKDNTLYESISGDLSNGEGDYLFVGLTGDSSRRRALMAFDVARDIPAGSIIHAATLTLHMSRTVGQTRDVSLHRLNSDWNEGSSHAGGEEGGGALATDGDATWLYTHYDSISPGTSPAWSTPGGDFATTASATTPVAGEGFYSWSSVVLAADAQAWLDNPASNFGWIAIGDEQTLATAKRFDSGENGNTASWPTLEVHFSPPSPNWGACCATDGSCGFSLDGADCSTQGGVYQGDATICSPNPCPQPTGACCMLDRSCGEVTQTQCAQAGGSFTGHLTTCAATECPVLDLQPYVDPLPIPAVAQPLSGAVGGEAHYEIAMTEFTQQLHSDLPPTTVWGYDGTFPGPTIEATADERVTVDWVNDLRDGQGAPRTDHYLPVDLCPHGPNMFGSTPRTVVHLHGAHTTEESDGYPEDTTLPGESNFYEYPNHQLPATLWYHDHALGITRLNVYMGLAGFYLIRDAFEQSLGLPDGEYEVPLVIQDRSFNVDGSFRYPEQWQETFFGDHNLVNGKVSPYLNVKQGKYRFRVLNGANSRTYTIALSGGVPLQVIGTDGGLLPAPVTMNEITLAPAERADIIIDFSALPPGTEVIMTNSASAPLVAPPGTNVTPDVMKFIVQGEAGFLGSIPATLRPITPHQEVDAVEHRDFELTRAPDPCTGFTWLINGLHWDDITEFPELGSTEVWNFINRSQMVHPMHMHLVMFQVLDRQQFQVVNDQVVPIGSPVPPAPHEAGWKDTVPVYPNEIVRVIAKFEDYTGKFAYHCHVIEHEDQEMMRQYQVVDSCGNGVLGPIEQCEVGDDTACPGLCQGDCTCASPPVCGNGVRETGEECDAADASTCSSGQCYGPGSSEGPECTCVPPSTDIPPGGGVVVGITSGASNLSGSCGSGSANAPEQALTWVPDFTGEVTLQTCSANTEFDTVLYVREGNLAATDIACADDTAGCGTSSGSPRQDRHGSRVTINVVAGLTYYVVVDGYRPSSGADEGAFELTVTPTGASLLPDLTATVSDLQIEFNTTVPAADLAEGCASAANGVDLLRFTGTTNNVGPGDLIAGDPGCPDCTQNPSAACTDPSFVCASAAGQGEFRNFASYELLDASGQNVVAQGYKRGFCLRDDVCSSGSPSYDCSFQGISAGCSDVYDSSLGCQYIEVTGLPAGDYMVRMTSDPLNLFQESNEANNVDLVPVTIPPASNIRPIAEPDSGTTDEDTPITVDVLFNDSDPDGLLEPSSVAVIVPASNGLTSVNPTNGMITYTPNPNYFGEDTFSYQVLDDLGGADAALVTITVNPINDPPTAADDSAYTLIEAQVTVDVLSNDSDPEGALDSTSVELISPPVNGGVFIDPLTGSIAYTPNPLFEGTDQLTYQVKDVEGLSDTALLTVQVTSLPSGVLPIPPGGGVIAGFTSGSSSYSGSCAGASANAPEQVFAWVPGVSGTAIIETCSLNTEFDTVLYARDGDIAGPELGCSDDVSGCAVSDGSIRSGRHGSRVTFDVVAGQTYYLFADAYSPSSGASEGNFELTVIPPGP